MRIQLAKVTRSRKGHPIRALVTIEAEAPSIGRGAQCAIHLSDPRVAYEHATVFVTGGARHVAGVGGAMLMVDGHTAGDIVLAPGSRFEIGPYGFTVEAPPEGFDLALAVELLRPLPDSLEGIMARSVTSLDAGGVSKRSMAYVGLAVVLVLFLLVPIINPRIPMLGGGMAATKDAPAGGKGARDSPAALKTAAEAGVSADFVWNPGPLATAHQKDAYNCVACHQAPFQRVRDAACLHCHEQMPGHVLNAGLQKALFGETRCAECHPDHRGGEAPIRADAGLCVSCHADLKRSHGETALGNAGDFLTSHPEFKLTLWRGPGPADVVRVPQSDKARIVETSNLKFPHDVHLKPNLKGPDGRETLTCASCHTPDTSQKHFVATDMNRDCVRCHELRFEPDVQSRQVPHGSAEEAWLLIQEFYAKISLGNIPVDTIDTGAIQRTIPMASDGIVTEAERQRRLKYAREKAQKVGVDLFEKRVCIVCHDVRRNSAGPPTGGAAVPWTIEPVRIASAWMPKARFDHSKHGTKDSDCKSCHSVERSKRSSDVAMPDLQSCRASGCHGGNEPTLGMVVSTCISCHDYHLDESHARLRPVAAPSTGTKQ